MRVSALTVLPLLTSLAACSGAELASTEDEQRASAPAENWERDVLSTSLDVDVAARTAVARITLAPHARRGASFEVAGLTIEKVVDDDGQPVRHAIHDGQLDLGVPARSEVSVAVHYAFAQQAGLEGDTGKGVTFLWPHHCGNLFPCQSAPSDGLRLALELRNTGPGTAVYPREIPADAPAYMLAWAVGDYTYLPLGQTAAGTRVGAYHFADEEADAVTGTEPLRDVFEWLETTYGPYTFGSEVASVSARWGAGAFGGMEHHPFWHVSDGSMGDTETHAHEAIHGWYGNGVRIACWEDLTLSEGTTSYLTARALEAVRGTEAGDAVWESYEARLRAVVASDDRIAWPDSCDEVDVLRDLWNDVVYVKGAFFYRAVEAEVGKDALDAVLRDFYGAHKNQAAGMADMLDAIHAGTGFDAAPLADAWLRSLGHPEVP